MEEQKIKLALVDDRSYVLSMARPKRNEHTREKLLEQGMELLAEHGYHGTGLKAILDTVQVPKGSFYNYFASKEQYVSEIIERYSLNLTQRLDEYLESTEDDPVTAIRNIYNVVILELEKHGHKGCLIGNLAAEIGNSSSACQKAMQYAFMGWKDRIVPLVEDAQEKGLMRDDVPAEDLTEMFWSAWQGGLLKMKIDGGTAHLKTILDVMLGSLFQPCDVKGD